MIALGSRGYRLVGFGWGLVEFVLFLFERRG